MAYSLTSLKIQASTLLYIQRSADTWAASMQTLTATNFEQFTQSKLFKEYWLPKFMAHLDVDSGIFKSSVVRPEL